MKKNNVGKGLMLVGSLRKAGITTYMKQGQLITRVSYSYQKRSNTRSQFIARQKMRHTNPSQHRQNNKRHQPVHRHASKENLRLAPEVGSAKTTLARISITLALHLAEAANRQPV